MKWLQEVVQPQKDNRGLILLSHHQVFSAFDKEIYPKPAKQLADLLGSGERTVIWFWGHEHRLSLYGENTLPNGMKVFARCIGHGGMPVTVSDQPGISKPMNNLVVFDSREREKIDGTSIGHNGYVVLKLAGPSLVAEYYDDNDMKGDKQERKILEERWQWQDGKLQGVSAVDYTSSLPQKLSQLQDMNKAVQSLQGKTAAMA